MLQVGQRLDDYKIIAFLTSGGMGEIYLAEEFLLGRQVAIKIMRPEAMRYPNSDEGRKITQLFQREAAAIARLNHPNILPLYKQGTYFGNLQFSGDSQVTQMTLDITQQNQQRFEGTCTTINSLFGTNTFTLEHGTVDRGGNIQFTIVGTNFSGNTLIRMFTGTSESGGGWEGTFSDTGGNRGTWSVSQKAAFSG